MKALADCHLYGILDLGYVSPASALSTAQKMLDGGIDTLQLRAKKIPVSEIAGLALSLQSLTKKAGVPLVINDHPSLVPTTSAEALHIGQDDGALSESRKIIGDTPWIGRSTHSVEQAVAAEKEGADYIGFGPLFSTPTKPDYTPIGLEKIREVHEKVKIPIFCIGGIKRENLQTVLDTGATRVVIVSGILQAPDIPRYIQDCRELLLKSPQK